MRGAIKMLGHVFPWCPQCRRCHRVRQWLNLDAPKDAGALINVCHRGATWTVRDGYAAGGGR